MEFLKFLKKELLSEAVKSEHKTEIEFDRDSSGLIVTGTFGPKHHEDEYFIDDERYWYEFDFYFEFEKDDDGEAGNKWVNINKSDLKVESLKFVLDNVKVSGKEKEAFEKLKERAEAFKEKFKDGKTIVDEIFVTIEKQFVDDYKKIMK